MLKIHVLKGAVCKARCLFIGFAFIPFFAFSQKVYTYPRHSLGIDINQSNAQLVGFSYVNLPEHNFDQYFGNSFVLNYQYAPKKSFFGLQSGIGFFMWGGGYRFGYLNGDQKLRSLGIPLALQLKVSQSFWIETGLQTNFAVQNTGSLSEEVSPGLAGFLPSGSAPLMELQSVLGFRYHIFRTLAFKLRLHYGLTPAYRVDYMELITYQNEEGHWLQKAEERSDNYRFYVIELGISYLFPLKK